MDLVYLFRRLVFAQVMLGVVAFCMAERNPGMLLVAGALGTLSWYVAEGPTGRPLPQWTIHFGALLAVLWLIWEVRRYYGGAEDNEINYGMIVAMGHFTMWLQILQLYGRKTNREYALILVLGLMQMIGASVLSVSMVYGVLLAAYCVLALSTVLLFQLKTMSDQVLEVTRAAAADPARITRGQPVVGRGHRWQFRTMAALIGAGCAAVAVTVFVGLPRSGEPLQTALGGNLVSREVGFSQQVSLGGGSINSGNRDAVLKLTLSRPTGAGAASAIGMLLRGAALDHYDEFRHVWERSPTLAHYDRPLPLDSGFELARVDDQPVLEAEITLRNPPYGLLFTPYPPVYLETNNVRWLAFNPYDQRLSVSLNQSGLTGPVSYRVRFPGGSPATDLVRQYRVRVGDVSEAEEGDRVFDFPTMLYRGDVRTLGGGWRVQRQRFARMAAEILRNAGVTLDPEEPPAADDHERIARALTQYLQSSPQFSYSLDIPSVAPGEDPVAAFLFRHKRGHCELFASALAAMTRSIGMRARVATGYRVSEFNSVGDYYVVRESNAHAWTEIFCEGRGWVAFDATPPETVANEHARKASVLSWLGDVYEHLEFTWISSFVAYDQRTRARLFTGIQKQFTQAAEDDETAIGKVVAAVKNLREAWRFDKLSYLLISGICFFILLGIASLVHTLIKRHRRLVALQLTTLPRARRRGLARRLRFYLIMLDMLERHGLSRPRWQSPFDFASGLAENDAKRFDPVLQLTEVFYEIRFGHREMDDDRRERVRANLRRLETALATR